MKKPQTIVTSCEETVEGLDRESLYIAVYDTPAEAKRIILNTLAEESRELGEEYREDSGTISDMFTTRWREGSFSYRIGTHTYHYRWMNVPGEYGVKDDEVVSALDAFCNSNRTGTDFLTVARRISNEMHRYVQNELWKFVTALIRAFAEGGYDDRNRTARNQARILQSVIETDPEF